MLCPVSPFFPALYGLGITVIRGPYASDTLVGTPDWLVHSPVEFARGIPQHLDLVHDLVHVALRHAHRPGLAIDVMGDDGRVFLRFGRHRNLNFGVACGELG